MSTDFFRQQASGDPVWRGGRAAEAESDRNRKIGRNLLENRGMCGFLVGVGFGPGRVFRLNMIMLYNQ